MPFFAQGIHVDESKVMAIQEWPVPTSIQQVKSFHGLASFYKRFVKNFSSIVAPMNEVIKGRTFQWNEAAQFAFEEIKRRLTSALTLALRSFSRIFEVECDAFRVGIGDVLSPHMRPIAHFSEKLNETKSKYSTYVK